VVADDLLEIILQAGRGVNDATRFKQLRFESRDRLDNGERLKINDEAFSGASVRTPSSVAYWG
jgi:hypothetical protein